MEQRLFEYKKEERANEVLVGENIDISTKLSSRPNVLGNVDPLKYVLYPWQILLGRICRTLRIIRNIILWEVCIYPNKRMHGLDQILTL